MEPSCDVMTCLVIGRVSCSAHRPAIVAIDSRIKRVRNIALMRPRRSLSVRSRSTHTRRSSRRSTIRSRACGHRAIAVAIDARVEFIRNVGVMRSGIGAMVEAGAGGAHSCGTHAGGVRGAGVTHAGG